MVGRYRVKMTWYVNIVGLKHPQIGYFVKLKGVGGLEDGKRKVWDVGIWLFSSGVHSVCYQGRQY